MSVFLPNSVVTIYRAESSTNEYGETVDDNTTPAASGVRAYIQEGWTDVSGRRTQTTLNPATGRSGLIEEYTIRFRPGTDVREKDRIKDETNNMMFNVRYVVRPYSLVGYPDIRVSVTRTGSYSQPENG